MKVFISWSGEQSHAVAMVLRDWLPSVLQSIVPYVSSEDIDKGARWSSDIASELEESSFGILCVTEDNVEAPWLNFEAGALGKSVDKSRVCPFLFGVKRSQVSGPLLQFQSTIRNQEDVLKLLVSMNAACGDTGIEEPRLVKALETWWPDLDSKLNEIETTDPEPSSSEDHESGYVANVLEELLEISRMNQRLLRDPESLVPPNYLQWAIARTSVSGHGDTSVPLTSSQVAVDSDALRAAVAVSSSIYRHLEHHGDDVFTNPEVARELVTMIREQQPAMDHLQQQLRRKRRRRRVPQPDS